MPQYQRPGQEGQTLILSGLSFLLSDKAESHFSHRIKNKRCFLID